MNTLSMKPSAGATVSADRLESICTIRSIELTEGFDSDAIDWFGQSTDGGAADPALR